MAKHSTSYKIKDDTALYYLTFATVEWVDIFTRKRYKDIVVDSLKYCQQKKGLQLYSWVLMSNHVHMVARAEEGFKLSEIIRDFKRYTSVQIVKSMKQETESRRDWLLKLLQDSGKVKGQNHQLWRNDNHPIELYSNDVIDQKINYIHQNPVVEGIVRDAEDYLYSSGGTIDTLLQMEEM
ncbi:MAG: transposase [Bacteroidetes bacterium]|nr:transposase [Bacteroidota bacterium]